MAGLPSCLLIFTPSACKFLFPQQPSFCLQIRFSPKYQSAFLDSKFLQLYFILYFLICYIVPLFVSLLLLLLQRFSVKDTGSQKNKWLRQINLAIPDFYTRQRWVKVEAVRYCSWRFDADFFSRCPSIFCFSLWALSGSPSLSRLCWEMAHAFRQGANCVSTLFKLSSVSCSSHIPSPRGTQAPALSGGVFH